MALTVTSAPWQQVNMPALDLRRYLGVGLQEGVVGSTDMAVAQRGAGANFSVDIAAGEALIQGDTVSNQGRYYVLNDATFNLTGFTAANATNPRIDRVTLRIRDAFHGDAANDVSFQVVTGTATAGATLSNLNGAAAVPSSQLLLANILIPATATTITTANIDTTVRPRASGNGLLGVRVFTSSGTYTPTPGTNRVYVECVGGGGGGGGSATGATTQGGGGGGGGGGGYSASFLTSNFSGKSYAIGAAGTGATAGNNSGGAGGDTTFDTTVIVAKGGTGGTGSGISGGTGIGGGPGAGGAAGSGTGDTKVTGSGGQFGLIFGPNSQAIGGSGGASVLGGQAATTGVSGATSTGNAGGPFGGGGAGGAVGGNFAAAAGGAGAAGVIRIWEFS